MDREYAEYLLKKIKEDYDLVAENFSRTRAEPWEELKFLREYVTAGEKILDLGCGNGRFYEVLKGSAVGYFGVDNSKRLIEIAREKYPKVNFQTADALKLPFPNNYFDKVYSVAVLHHIPSEEFRLQFLREAKRVLKQEGLLILTVWDLWRRETAWKLFFKYTFLRIIRKSKFDFKDIFYPWKSRAKKVLAQRYFHLFTKKELRQLTKKAGFTVKETGVLKRPGTKDGNIYLIAVK